MLEAKNFFASLHSLDSLETLKLFEINKSNKFSIQKVMQIKNSIKGRINIVRDIIYDRMCIQDPIERSILSLPTSPILLNPIFEIIIQLR